MSADWPGKRLGLPEAGPRSIGRLGRRLGALVVDWGLSYLLSFAFFRPDTDGFATLRHLRGLAAGLPAGREREPRPPDLRLAASFPLCLATWACGARFVRTVLLCLFIPAVIYDKDQRGLHDRWAGTVLVRR